MTADNETSGLEGLNLNVTLLRQDVAKLENKLDTFADRYVPLQAFEERSKYQGERTGSLEKEITVVKSDLKAEIAEMKTTIAKFIVAFVAPVVVTVIGAMIFAAIKIVPGAVGQ